MTKVTNIPGRLHSVEQGNIVAGANEVYDDTKGKKQNVINSETDAELLRLEQTKQDNLTFDNEPTENSNNPVKSGGVYAADLALQQAIEAILLLIPSAATSLNQLADKAFVNSSISTATATFRGTYNVVTDLHLAVDATHAQIETALASVIATADNNDYCFVQTPVSSSSQDIQKTSRYKFNGSAWVFEYDLNTSGFTLAQWAAINSGITAALVTKLGALPTASELSEDLQGLSTAIQGILDLIPSAATSSNKLTDKVYVDGLIQAITELIPAEATDQNQLADKAYVLAQILAATPAFKGQFTTLAALEDVSSPKAGDIGIVRTTDNDGFAVFTFYQYLNDSWNVYYTLAHHLQNKPATTGNTGDYPYNGMGRVVLPMNIKEIGGVTANYLEQSMVPTATGGNTIYVITHDYVLASNITIPDNCVLEFDGGTFANLSGNTYTLGLNSCQIHALNDCVFKGVTLTGTINGIFNLCWVIDGDDITDAINNLSADIKEIVFRSTKTFYVNNTVTFRNISYLDWEVCVYYNGTQSNRSVVIIRNSVNAKVDFKGEFNPVSGNTAVNQLLDNTNVVGLEIINCQDCTFYINGIGYFNENVRVSGIGAGCVSNSFYFGRLFCANRHLRIYQEDYNGDKGWANENYFYGGHFFNSSSWRNAGNKATAIHIEGGTTDTYNHCNSLTFREFNLEGYSNFNGYTIYAKNIRSCSFLRIRNEAGDDLIKLVGECLNIDLESTFGPNTADLSDVDRVNPFANKNCDYNLDIRDIMSYLYKNSRDRWISEIICGGFNYYKDIYNTGSGLFGVCIKYVEGAFLKISTNQSSNGGLAVAFCDENFQNLTANVFLKAPFINSPTLADGFARATWSGNPNLDMVVPKVENAAYMFIGYYVGVNESTYKELCISSNNPIVLVKQKIPKRGLFADRPNTQYQIPVSWEYFCTDLGKKIIFNGTAWVDEIGNAVSTVYMPVISGGTTGNVPMIKADGTLEDSSKAAADIP